MKKFIILFMMACMSVSLAMAQKTCVVASAEDHVPIREALIHTNNNHWARTDYRGYWTMKYQFDSATVSKKGFLKTTVYLKELPDTVFLLPESQQIGTVEVWGKNQQHIQEMNQQIGEAAAEAGRNASLGKTRLVGFDLGNMLDARGRRDYKHLKKAKKILGEYERKDPIVSAYEKATGQQYGKKTEYEKYIEKQDSGLVVYKGVKMTPEERKIERTKNAIDKTVEVFNALHKGTPITLKKEDE